MFKFEVDQRDDNLWFYVITDEWDYVWDEADGFATEDEAYEEAEERVAFHEDQCERKRAVEWMH